MAIQKSKNPKNKPVSVYLGREETNKLNQIMKITGLTKSDSIRRLIQNADIDKIETIEDKVKRLSNGRLSVVNLKVPKEMEGEYEDIRVDDLIGSVNVPDDKKPFNPVEAVKEVRTRKGG